MEESPYHSEMESLSWVEDDEVPYSSEEDEALDDDLQDEYLDDE